MKILMVSIFSEHFFNWASQLDNSGHEVFWIDVLDSNTYVEKLHFAHQIAGWRYKLDYPGRYFLKKNFPSMDRIINKLNERNFQKVFEEQLRRIKPDIVHSFTLHLGCISIYPIMVNYPKINWIYSSWGSDLFYYRKSENYRNIASKILRRVDYMFTDCKRDYSIAKEMGFMGTFLGVFPGRGGFELKSHKKYIQKFEDKKTILVKGYEGKHGEAINVIKALEKNLPKLADYEIKVFGATQEVIEYYRNFMSKTSGQIEVLGKIPHQQVMKLFGQSLIYIGNSKSDGTPNTLLEAIVMDVFPIQSNPGGATAEIIKNKFNGALIEFPEDPERIGNLILEVVEKKDLIFSGINYNSKKLKPLLDRDYVKRKVLQQYNLVGSSNDNIT